MQLGEFSNLSYILEIEEDTPQTRSLWLAPVGGCTTLGEALSCASWGAPAASSESGLLSYSRPCTGHWCYLSGPVLRAVVPGLVASLASRW